MEHKRILVVDDDPLYTRMLSELLSSEGYVVQTAADGVEAARKLPNGFDLLVTDVIMPQLDGFELLSLLQEKYPELRAIVMSGGGEYTPEDICLRYAHRLGATHVISKKAIFDEIVPAVKRLFTIPAAEGCTFSS